MAITAGTRDGGLAKPWLVCMVKSTSAGRAPHGASKFGYDPCNWIQKRSPTLELGCLVSRLSVLKQTWRISIETVVGWKVVDLEARCRTSGCEAHKAQCRSMNGAAPLWRGRSREGLVGATDWIRGQTRANFLPRLQCTGNRRAVLQRVLHEQLKGLRCGG